MGRGKSLFTSEFVPEWCAIAFIAVLDTLWATQIHLTFTATGRGFLVLGLALSLTAARRADGGIFFAHLGGLHRGLRPGLSLPGVCGPAGGLPIDGDGPRPGL